MSDTPKTTKEEATTDKSTPTESILAEAERSLSEVMDQLKPLLAFHKAAADASNDDVRMYWDVRLVRGKDTHFAHVIGETPLPRLLASNMVAKAPGRIEQEIVIRIIEPLVSVMQEEAEKQTFDNLAKREKTDGVGASSETDLSEEGGD